MKKLVALFFLLGLTACAGVGSVVGTITGASVSGQTVLVSVKAFDGAQLVAATYLGLRICTDATRPICREPSATPVIKGAILSGRVARNALKTQLRQACASSFAANTPCTTGIPIASYNTLVAATQTIQDATAAYRAATSQ